jgi:hypothetical protein
MNIFWWSAEFEFQNSTVLAYFISSDTKQVGWIDVTHLNHQLTKNETVIMIKN